MRDFFHAVREAGFAIERIRSQQARYKDLATALGVNLTGMPIHHGGTSKVELAAIGLADLRDELAEKMLAYEAMIKRAQQIIDAMPTERYRTLLTERYINLCSWPEVTRRVGYKDEKSVFRANKFALSEAAAGCIPPLPCDTV